MNREVSDLIATLALMALILAAGIGLSILVAP